MTERLDSGPTAETMRTFLARNPVLVLGPGCQRIGYDEATHPGWSSVRTRLSQLRSVVPEEQRVFLDTFWASKSARGLHPDGKLDSEIEFTEETPIVERATVELLARPALEALWKATTALGTVIAGGETPVLRWTHVRAPGAAPETEEVSAAVARLISGIQQIQKFSKNRPPDQLTITRGGRSSDYAVSRESAHELSALATNGRLNVVLGSVNGFAGSCLGAGRSLTGANVEWLADLFWHLVIWNAKVPPSQSELAFELNLTTPLFDVEHTRARPAQFVRSRPGESRTLDDERQKRFRGILERRLTASRSESAAAFYHVMAGVAAVHANQPVGKLLDGITILSSEQDLAFELTLAKILDDEVDAETRLHIVVPMEIKNIEPGGDGQTVIAWLVASIEAQSLLQRNPLRDAKWRPLHEVTTIPNREPVIVHLSGLAAVRLSRPGRRITAADLDLAGVPGPFTNVPEPTDAEVRLATITDDYEAAKAINEFISQAAGSDLTVRLNWYTRSWLFLGEGFPEWIPRLRLLYTSSAFTKPSDQASGRRLAVDKQFSWQEASMLTGLKVEGFYGDLGWFVDFPDRPDGGHDPFIRSLRPMLGGGQ